MATIEVSPARPVEEQVVLRRQFIIAALIIATLTLISAAILGYHPYAEDGGIYLPGIQKILNPELFPAWSTFVTVQSRFSLFPRLVADLVVKSGLNLMIVMLLLHLLSVSLILLAAWKIIALCFERKEIQVVAVSLLALTLSMPIAGTSLMLMDPYVTARSFSTPLGVFAIARALGIVINSRRYTEVHQSDIVVGLGSLVLAAIIHPLMAAYTAVCVALLLCMAFRSAKWRYASVAGLCLTGFMFAACLALLSAPRGSLYAQVARSRTYWFIDSWQWYEQVGLVAPLLLTGLLWLRGSARNNVAVTSLAQMVIAAGVTAASIAITFGP